jgi:lipoprotein-anchoring transpeptidase ErfK/SrfK
MTAPVTQKRNVVFKPGPNNPVGLVWIALSEKGYGIPDPSKISKSESHGCIRLINWSALQVASVVSKGTPADFIGNVEARDAIAKRNKARRKRAR